MGIIEAFFTAITKPVVLVKKLVTTAFYWSTRIFGVSVAAFQKDKGE
jgi:hypothetical protein